MKRPPHLALLVGLATLLVACATTETAPPADPPRAAEHREPTGADLAPDTQEPPSATSPGDGERPQEPGTVASPRPDWLGTRVLPLAADGFGERLPTPPELADRRLATPPLPDPAPLDPAPSDAAADRFAADVGPVPGGVLARSTWTEACPVTVDELRYVVVRHFGFDGRAHTGELIVHADVADDVVRVFAALHAARFPLEEVRVIRKDELSAPPTGDGNVTSAFVCRPTVGGTRWSEHAYGRAIDLNPFHNPYVRGDLVIPELASAYVDRDDVRPGMIVAGDAVSEAFASIGWGWGGAWSGAATDPMHFSVSGR